MVRWVCVRVVKPYESCFVPLQVAALTSAIVTVGQAQTSLVTDWLGISSSLPTLEASLHPAAAEVEHIIAAAKPRIERSGVVDTDTGAEQVSEIRTSSGMFFERGENDVIRRMCPDNPTSLRIYRGFWSLCISALINLSVQLALSVLRVSRC